MFARSSETGLGNATELSNMFCSQLDFECCNFIFLTCNFHESLAIRFKQIKYLPADRIFMPFPAFVSNQLDRVVLGLGEEVIGIRYSPV